MSFIDINRLKSNTDQTINSITRVERFSTTVRKFDSLLEYGMIIKTVKIVNNDQTAVVGYRNQSPSSVMREVPISSDETIDEWTSYFEIIPNSNSGSGYIEFELVETREAYRVGQ